MVPSSRATAAPLRFAHRGAPVAPTRGNTLAAFERALRDGAEGLESDVRLTADGVPVLVHGLARFDRRPLRQLTRAELPPDVAALEELWQRCGNGFELSLDMADPDAAEAVVALARRFGAYERLWLTYWRLPTVAAWRRRWPDVHIVYPTLFGFPNALLRRTAQRVAVAGADALNLHHRLVNRNTAGVVKAAGLQCFAWGLRHEHHVRRARALGMDAVYVDDLSPIARPVRR
jgi:glycerophosphoryl diester phosphodiesterase